MEDLGAAKAAVRAAMVKDNTGTRAYAERVDQLLDDYQHALKRVATRRLTNRLAAMLRTEGDKLGYNRQLAYRRCAALVEEAEVEL